MCFGAWCVLVALLFFDFFCMYIYIYAVFFACDGISLAENCPFGTEFLFL